ncbi:hypothetical protein CIHG_00701 [Coccidioides immitis H538.4]|uniref:Uncharacterized protein n=1 Tax=Coccidioides immitis H538.4 TaxID=396776 RepID=A0A0J8RG01_COCIT|nr:hypothetical protein CIHG_00701 [Coccidioides immitis H538.4]
MASPSQQANGTSSIDPYQQLHSYSFTEDPEFKLGLAVILRQPGTPATDEQVNRTDDLVMKAKCFYFSRKHSIQPPLDLLEYKAWLQTHPGESESQPQPQPQPQDQQLPSEPPQSTAAGPCSSASEQQPPPPQTTTTTTTTAVTPASEEEPAYPSSFAHIVELITTGQPIPGIQQIPDTILTGQEGPSTAARRRKPWERQGEPGVQGEECKAPEEASRGEGQCHEQEAKDETNSRVLPGLSSEPLQNP